MAKRQTNGTTTEMRNNAEKKSDGTNKYFCHCRHCSVLPVKINYSLLKLSSRCRRCHSLSFFFRFLLYCWNKYKKPLKEEKKKKIWERRSSRNVLEAQMQRNICERNRSSANSGFVGRSCLGLFITFKSK